MKRPSTWTYLAGNPVSFVGACLGFAGALWHFLATGQGGLLAFALLFAAGGAHTANARLRKYEAWRREWQAMEPPPSPVRRGSWR